MIRMFSQEFFTKTPFSVLFQSLERVVPQHRILSNITYAIIGDHMRGRTLFLILTITVLTVILAAAYSFVILGLPSGVGEKQVSLTEEQAIETGRVFLDSKNYTTGNVLSVTLEEMNPHYYFYWHELFGLEKTDVGDTELSWFVKFDQAENAGHWFLVCVDAHTGEIVGGSQCR